MKQHLLFVAVACLVLSPGAQAGVDIGLSIDDDGVSGFHLAIGDHYQAKEKEVVLVRQRGIDDEELPVIFFLARQASVAPATIVKLRLSGKSWMEISLQFGLSAKVFYVEFERDPGPPYGKAWGHFKKKKRSDWDKIRLADAEIVNLVNLKFIQERYGYTPSEICKMRSDGTDFVKIHKKIHAKTGPNKQAGSVASKGAKKSDKGGKKK